MGAKATRQPVTRTHERARPAAKPTRPTAQRRPAGAGVAPPPPHAQQRHDHASGRRRGGEAGGDGAGRAALGRGNRPPPMPSAQNAPFGRISSAADANGSDEHGAQAGGTAAGRGTLPPRAQSGARPSGRATGQATGRKADGRDGAAGESGRLCASVAVFFAGGG